MMHEGSGRGRGASATAQRVESRTKEWLGTPQRRDAARRIFGATTAALLAAVMAAVVGCSRAQAPARNPTNSAQRTAAGPVPSRGHLAAALVDPSAASGAASHEVASASAAGVLPQGATLHGNADVGARSTPPAHGESSLAKHDKRKKPDSDEEDEDETDYWEGVEFGPKEFDEVVEYVRKNYIDPHYDESRAWAEACVWTMRSLEHGYQVLPRGFYEKRKDNPDEKGRLKGKPQLLRKGLAVVLVPEPDDEDDPDKGRRLSDDELRERRKKRRERMELLDAEWKRVGFGRRDFETCLRKAKAFGEKDPDQDDKDTLTRDLWLAAAQGFLHSLDPHSSLISAKAWEESTRKTTDASFEGIGAILTKRDRYVVVETPIEGQPAVKAGLRAGDLIIKVDGQSVVGWELHKVVKRIRGPKGTRVVLTVRREGMPEDIDIPIVRAYIRIENVQSRIVPHHPHLGYVKLTGFVPTSTIRMRRAIEELKREANGKLEGLIFDLRGNSGGLLSKAVEISDMFLRHGNIVSVRERSESGKRHSRVYPATPEDTYDFPMVVLVNDSSASASEIVSGALQDNARALIIGERTFGKASVQTLFTPDIGSGYYIKLTVARYYSPAGRTIQVVGITPDIEVPPEIGKPMPLGFREEDLFHHLRPIASNYHSPNEALARLAEECAKKRGIAEQIHAADPNPQIKFDYQLYKAADVLECVIDLQREAKAKAPAAGGGSH